MTGHQQADVLAYDQIRVFDEQEWSAKLVGAGMPKGKMPHPRKR